MEGYDIKRSLTKSDYVTFIYAAAKNNVIGNSFSISGTERILFLDKSIKTLIIKLVIQTGIEPNGVCAGVRCFQTPIAVMDENKTEMEAQPFPYIFLYKISLDISAAQ